MKCPFCNSENYDFIDTMDYDESSATLEFTCRGGCGQKFYGIYSFMYFENESGDEIE